MKSLFDVNDLEINPDYVSPQEKKKWNKAFKKKILDDYNENDGKYCDICEMKYCNGASDCLVALKKYCKEHNIEINYKDFDFDKFLDNFR